jgi:hypothetical protein
MKLRLEKKKESSVPVFRVCCLGSRSFFTADTINILQATETLPVTLQCHQTTISSSTLSTSHAFIVTVHDMDQEEYQKMVLCIRSKNRMAPIILGGSPTFAPEYVEWLKQGNNVWYCNVANNGNALEDWRPLLAKCAEQALRVWRPPTLVSSDVCLLM